MDPRRIYLATGFAQGFLWAGWAVAAMPWWTVVLDLPPIQLILLGSALVGTILLAEIPTGVVADLFSRKWSVVASWGVVGVAQVMAPISEAFALLILWQVLWAIGFTLQSGADTAWVTDETGTDVDDLIMRHAIMRSIGIIFGILIAFATTQLSIETTMRFFGVGSILFAVALAMVMTETNFTPVDRGERSGASAFGETMAAGWRLTRSTRSLRVMAIATTLFSMADETVDRLDLRRLVELGFPDIDGERAVIVFGLIWILMTVFNIPVMLYVNRESDQLETNKTARLIRLMLFAGAVGVGAMALGVSVILAIVGWIVRDVSREVVEPLAVAWTNRQATSEIRATVLSFRSQAQALGQLGGGLALGLVAQYVSLAVAFGGAAALLAIAGLQFLLVEREPVSIE